MSKREKWKKAILNELVTLQRGHDLTSNEQKSGNIPVVGSYGIIGYHDTAKSKGPGVTVGRSGSIGEVQYIKTDYWPHNTCLYAINFHNNEVRYVYYFLKSMNLSAYNAGSAVPTLNRNHIHTIPVEIPPIGTQHKIVNVLGSLDDRIDLLKKINVTLEKVVRSLFKSWFIDFDGQTEFVDSELGEIPKGWKIMSLGDIVDFHYGKALKEEIRQKGSIPVYGSNGLIGWHDKALVKGPGIIIGRKGNPGTVKLSMTDFFPIDTTFYITSKSHLKSIYFLFNTLRNQNLQLLVSDTAVPGLNRNIAYGNKILVPPVELIEIFDYYVHIFYNMIHIEQKETEILIKLRDLLIPKLMSGEITV